MGWEAWFTLGVLALVLTALVRRWGPPDGVLMGGSLLCGIVGIITPEQVFSGFVNQGTLTIAAMFIVAAGVRETGALDNITHRVFGQVRTESQGLLRMSLPVVGLSALFNNTPIVAMLLPAVNDWCRRFGISPSRMLMPLSFLAILGGTCTLIGTSTSLALNGLMIQTGHEDLYQMGLFELAWVGVPFTVVGVVYLLTVGRRLLPNRLDLMARVEESPREYYADMQVQAGCRLVDRDIREAGLRNLPGIFLVELTRGEKVLSPVAPQEVIRESDILTFSGVVSMIRDLERIQGLVPVADKGYEARAAHRRGQNLCEAVISPRSPLIGKSIRDADFRSIYGAAVIAVHRGGERISGRIGDIVLRAGDTLLMQAGERFEQLHHNNPDFYLVSAVDESRPVRHDRAWQSTLLMVLLVVLIMTKAVSIVYAAFIVAGLMVITRCVSPGIARKSIDWETIFTISAAFGLGEALTESGAAEGVADFVLGGADGMNPYVVLAGLYIVTSLFAALISAKAAALLMFPIALSIALGIDVSPRPFIMCVALSSAATFATPIGYPTNLMVYGPGGYRFTDFVRVGLPLDVLLLAVSVVLIPWAWHF